jgi:L-ascorbate metabolism protein UlaG (beta-lactamase superfamily)
MLTQLLASLRHGLAPDPAWFTGAPRPIRHGVALTYLGTGGFVVEHGGHALVLDPYVTRASVADVAVARLVPDEARIARYIPRAHDVLVGHAHFDHILDAPSLCARTGARLIGSRAVCMVGRAAGLPEGQLVETRGREDIVSGPFTVRGVPSKHGKVLLGRVLFPGDIEAPPSWPARAYELRHGLVLNWHVKVSDFSLVHVDSADFVRRELSGLKADVVCLCAAGRQYRPHYVEEIIELLGPRIVIPCHWDTMITPMEASPSVLPGVDLPGMMGEIRRAGAEPLLMPFFGYERF